MPRTEPASLAYSYSYGFRTSQQRYVEMCLEKHVLPRQGRSWDWQAAYKTMWNARWLRAGERGLDLGKDPPDGGTSFRENKFPVES